MKKKHKFRMKFSTSGKDPKFREVSVTAPDTRSAWKRVKQKYKSASFGEFVKKKGHSYPSGKDTPRIK